MGDNAPHPTGHGLLAIYTALLGLSTVILLLRIFARSTRGNKLGLDDYMMVLAWVSTKYMLGQDVSLCQCSRD